MCKISLFCENKYEHFRRKCLDKISSRNFFQRRYENFWKFTKRRKRILNGRNGHEPTKTNEWERQRKYPLTVDRVRSQRFKLQWKKEMLEHRGDI